MKFTMTRMMLCILLATSTTVGAMLVAANPMLSYVVAMVPMTMVVMGVVLAMPATRRAAMVQRSDSESSVQDAA